MKKIILTLLFLCILFPINTYAEGSKTLAQYGGSRMYIEYISDPNVIWANGYGENIQRQQVFYVYAKEGEKIYFGSSMPTATTISDDFTKDISITDVDGAIHYYDVLSNSNFLGNIRNIAQENAGPIQLGNPSGYNAFVYDVPKTGIYEFRFYARTGAPSRASYNASWGTQGYGVAAFDVTVTDASNNIKDGRMYSTALFSTSGGDTKSNLYVVTNDGYKYLANLNGIDPNGMIFFASNRGLINKATDLTVYHSTLYTNNNMTDILGGVGFKNPMTPDTAKDKTHLIFVNDPDQDVLDYMNVNKNFENIIPENLKFNDEIAIKKGDPGFFTFDLIAPASIDIAIVIDNDTNNIVHLSMDGQAGHNSIAWNGLDKFGNIPDAGNYSVTAMQTGGETHFLFLDVENSNNGFVLQLLSSPSGIETTTNSNIVYYDNSNITLNGDKISFTNTSNNTNSSFTGSLTNLEGLDSSLETAMKYSGNFGNLKLLDIWNKYNYVETERGTVIYLYDAGYVNLTKDVVGDTTDNTFKFALYKDDNLVTNYYYRLNNTSDKLLSKDGYITIDKNTSIQYELPVGEGYKIVEVDSNASSTKNAFEENTNDSNESEEFSVEEDHTYNLTFTNIYDEKVVDNPNTSDKFTIHICIYTIIISLLFIIRKIKISNNKI